MFESWDDAIELINRWGVASWKLSGAMLVESSVLVAVLLLVDWLTRRRVRAVVRYGLWLLVLAKLVLPTGLASPTSPAYWLTPERVAFDAHRPAKIEAASIADEAAPTIAGAETISAQAAMLPTAATEVPAARLSQPATPRLASLDPRGIALLVWLVAVVALFALLFERAVKVRRIVSESVAASAALTALMRECAARIGIDGRRIGVRISDRLPSPAICGLLRPTILLPRCFGGRIDDEQLRHVFLHELLHWKRFDLHVNWLQTMLQIVYFYSPAVWLANRMVRGRREEAVDEAVLVALGGQAERYGATLLEIAALAISPAESMQLVGVVESRRALGSRLQRILTLSVPRSSRLGLAGWAMVGLVALVVVPLGGRRLVADDEASASQPKAASATDSNGLKSTTPGELRGRVVFADSGKPAAGADVRISREPVDYFTLPLKRKQTTADERGEFTFDGLGKGTFLLTAFLGNDTSRSERFKFEKIVFDEQRRQQTPCELKLKPGVTLRIRVLSQATGEALSDAKLRIRWTDAGDNFPADKQGEITVPALTAEQWHLEVVAAGHAADIRDLALTGPETLLEVRLPPGGEVTGRVVDEAGRPMSGARVAIANEGSSMYTLDQATTDKEGRYRLQYLPLKKPLSLSASKKGFDWLSQPVNVSSTAPVDVDDVKLKPLPDGGTVRGIVVDAKGNPIAGAALENTGNSTANVRTAANRR